jgi:hypothetical protein
LPQDGSACGVVDNKIAVRLEVEKITRVARSSSRIPSTMSLRYVINKLPSTGDIYRKYWPLGEVMHCPDHINCGAWRIVPILQLCGGNGPILGVA